MESVEQEKYAHQSKCGWKQVLDTHVFLSVDVEAWEEPNCENCQLQQNNVTIITLVVWNFAGSSNGPGEKWIGEDKVDEKGGEVPEPR